MAFVVSVFLSLTFFPCFFFFFFFLPLVKGWCERGSIIYWSRVRYSFATEKELIVVGGHKSAIRRGPRSANGAETIVKVVTAWEVLMYLRMTLCVDAGMMELARFAPTLVAVLPPTTEDVSDWISVESEDNRPKLKEVLLRLQHASDNTEGYSEVMDTALWFICLIDVTATMCMPCVADVKLGFLRHSPQTPAAKLERIRKKRISQPYALRLCGAHHYVYHHSDNNERHLEVEWCEKDMGYALETEEEYRRVIRAFFSSTISMHADKTLKKNDDNDDVLLVESRLQYCRRVVERLLCFFTSSLGRALLEKTAFVSTSLLFVYDAGDNKKSDPCSDNSDRSHVYLIDYARSSDRRLNYTEETIGFVHGIENMLRFLS